MHDAPMDIRMPVSAAIHGYPGNHEWVSMDIQGMRGYLRSDEIFAEARCCVNENRLFLNALLEPY